MIQMISGHNRLNRHNSLIDPRVSPTCRLCKEEEETSWHLIGDCPMLLSKRWQIFNSPFLEDPPDWRPWKVLRFLYSAKIVELNERVEEQLSQNL